MRITCPDQVPPEEAETLEFAPEDGDVLEFDPDGGVNG